MPMFIKKNILRVSFVALLQLAFVSCGVFDSDEELRPLEGDILFSVQEGYRDYSTTEEPGIVILMNTEKVYGCCNWSIKHRISCMGNRITIDIVGILVPEICLTAEGPARAREFLNISDGEYSLRFTYRNNRDKYTLSVSDSSICITKLVSHFTEPQVELFWRYPPKSIAYLCGTTTEASWMCEEFLDTLLGEINLREFQFPDSGAIPYPRSSDGHYYDMPAKYFIYQDDDDFDKAGEILRAYTEQHIQNSGIGISLISWTNKKYLSWLFN